MHLNQRRWYEGEGEGAGMKELGENILEPRGMNDKSYSTVSHFEHLEPQKQVSCTDDEGLLSFF